jgi:hypothetical protein
LMRFRFSRRPLETVFICICGCGQPQIQSPPNIRARSLSPKRETKFSNISTSAEHLSAQFNGEWLYMVKLTVCLWATSRFAQGEQWGRSRVSHAVH